MKLGICFAGGGIKAAAHIGVIKALEEENLQLEYIGGTSSGSIITLLYALGFTSSEMLEIFKKYAKKIKYVQIKNIIKLLLGILIKRKIIINGLNSGNKIEKIVKKVCKKRNVKNINEISKSIVIPSVDIENGEIIVFSSLKKRNRYSDNIIYVDNIEIEKAVRASCSFPGVFSPYEYRNRYLVDGGIRENIPWKILKENGAKKVISVVFSNEIEKKEKRNIFDILYDSLQILCHELSNYEIEGADYVIKITTKDVSLLDSKKVEYLYNLGYVSAKEKIKKIKEEIEKQKINFRKT